MRTRLLAAGALVAAVLAVQQFPLAGAGSGGGAGGSGGSGPPVSATAAELGSAGLPGLAAPAQSALDRLLGPGHAVVSAAASRGQGGSSVALTYDPNHVAVLSQAQSTGPGYRASARNNGVSSTVTRTQVQPGQVQRLTVAVVVDSSVRPAPNVALLRRAVVAAMGLRPGRGDRITVASMPFRPVVPSGSAASRTAPGGTVPVLTGYLPSAVAGLAALILFGAAVLDRWRRRRPAVRGAV